MKQDSNSLFEWKLTKMEKIESLLNLFSSFH